MIANKAVVPSRDIGKVLRLRAYGFVLKITPMEDEYVVEILKDPRL